MSIIANIFILILWAIINWMCFGFLAKLTVNEKKVGEELTPMEVHFSIFIKKAVYIFSIVINLLAGWFLTRGGFK